MSKKTIIEIFKTQEQNFAQVPPATAWEKLEKKLNRNKKGATFFQMPLWSAAASILLLIGALTFTTYWLSTQKQKALFASIEPRPQEIEFLISSDASENYAQSLNQIKVYREKLALLDNPEPTSDFDHFAQIENQHKASPNISTTQQPAESAASEPAIAMTTEPAKFETESQITPQASNTYFEKMDRAELKIQSGQNFAPPAKAKRQTLAEASVRTFTWLVGAWEQDLPTGKSVENWVLSDSNTIDGKGFVLQGDDTVFTEKMTLRQINGKLVLFQTVSEGSEMIPFYLSEKSDTQWVFENSSLPFPNTVVLTKRDSAQYEAKFIQSKDQKNSGQFSPDQRLFLNQRNAIFYSNTSRSMKRVRR